MKFTILVAALAALTAAVTPARGFGAPASGEWYIDMHVVPPAGTDQPEEHNVLQFKNQATSGAECEARLATVVASGELQQFIDGEEEHHGEGTAVTFTCKQELSPA